MGRDLRTFRDEPTVPFREEGRAQDINGVSQSEGLAVLAQLSQELRFLGQRPVGQCKRKLGTRPLVPKTSQPCYETPTGEFLCCPTAVGGLKTGV